MAITITLAGTDRTAYCDLQAVRITNTIQANADKASLEVAVSSTDGWNPQAGNEIVIANGTTKEFGGIVDDLDEWIKSPTRLRYRLDCRDYTYLFDRRRIVDESTASLTAGGWVSRIISGFTTGFTDTNVSAGPSIAPRRFDYIAPSEAVRSLADEVGYTWFIDYDKDVHFVSSLASPAPTPTVNADSDTTTYGNLRLRETVSGVKTRAYMKNWRRATVNSWTQSFLGDATARAWSLGFEPTSVNSADFNADVNGTSLDLLTDFLDGQPGTAVGTSSQLFVQFDPPGVRFSSGISALSSTQTLNLVYKVMEDAVTQVEDTMAQTEMAAREGGDGIHEYPISDPTMTAADGSEDLAFAKGSALLVRYAYPRVTGSFETYNDGWRAGQFFTLASTRRLGGVSQTMYVLQVQKTIVNHDSGGSPTFKSLVQFADGVAGV